jgi:AcrR family transcriptional regulator
MLRDTGAPIALNTLAKRASVGVGTVYRHFPTSKALLEAIAAEGLGELEAEIREAAAETDPWAAVERIVRAQVRLEVRHDSLREVLAVATSTDPGTRHMKTEMARLVGEILERASAAGVLHAAVTPNELTNMLCGVGYTARLTPGRAEEVAELYVKILLHGFRA